MTTGAAALACQGCASHFVAPNHASIAPANDLSVPIVLSDGQRMATEGAFVTDWASGHGVLSTSLSDQVLGPQPRNEAPATIVDLTAPFEPVWLANIQTTRADRAITGPDWSRSEGLRAFESSRDAVSLIQPLSRDQNFTAEFAIAASSAQTGLGFDVALAPSLSVREEGEFFSRSLGAQLRFGQNFDQRGTGATSESWYVFAGTEGEALIWEAGENGLSNFTDSVALRDQVTVGDLQAGLSIQRGPGQLSLSYIRREVEWRDRNRGASTTEDFAGISFTLRQ